MPKTGGRALLSFYCICAGRKLALPLLIAPMAMQRMAHPDGELAVSRAAAAEGICMVCAHEALTTSCVRGTHLRTAAQGAGALLAGQVQSTMGTVPLADVREAGRAAGSPLMLYQLYVFKDRDFTRQMVKSAQPPSLWPLPAWTTCHPADGSKGCCMPLAQLVPLGPQQDDTAVAACRCSCTHALACWVGGADAEAAGYGALVVTVDAPVLGKREADERNQCAPLPHHCTRAWVCTCTRSIVITSSAALKLPDRHAYDQRTCRGNGAEAVLLCSKGIGTAGHRDSAGFPSSAIDSMHVPACCSFKLPGDLVLANVEGLVTGTAEVKGGAPDYAQEFSNQIDPSLTWEFVAWLRSVCSLPLFIKARGAPLAPLCPGIEHPLEDKCCEAKQVVGFLSSSHYAGISVCQQASSWCGGMKAVVVRVESSLPAWQLEGWQRAGGVGWVAMQGVLSGADAERALDAGVDGIVVSNHGGRQLDGAQLRNPCCEA